MVAGNFMLENEKLPYIVLSKLATSPFDYDSCAARLEEHTFRFNIYGVSCPEVEQIIQEIETLYDFSSLNLSNRIFNGILWGGTAISELEPGIWQGIVDYTVYTLKEFNGNNSTTSGKTIQDVVIKRAEENNLLHLVGRINLGLQLEQNKYIDYPFVSVPDFVSSVFDLTSLTRQEQVEYSFLILSYKLDQLEEIIAAIENLYDYCSYDINKSVLINEWAGNNIVEIEPGLFQAEINYTAVLEKVIV